MTTRPFSRRGLLGLGAVGAAGLTGALSGCGGDSVTGDPGSSTGPASLQFMYWGSTFEQKAVAAMLKSFEADTPGTTVKPLYTPADYETKMNALVASNRQPDVAYLGNSLAYKLSENGKLVNLFDQVDKHPSLAERLPQTYFWSAPDTIAGCATAPEILMMWYNRDIFAEAGVEPPPATADTAWTWDTFVERATALTLDQEGRRPDQDGFDPSRIRQFGCSFGGVNINSVQAMCESRGTSVFNEDCTSSLLDTPEVIEVVQSIADLAYKHRVAPTATQLGNNAPTTTVQLQTKRIAMALDGQWILLDLGESNLNYGCGVLPKHQESRTVMMTAVSSAFSGTKNLDRAMDLYMYHNDPTQVDLFAKGLWMPLEKKYYTDQAAIDSWIKNDVHPAEYRTAGVDYALNNSSGIYANYIKNQAEIAKVLDPALQLINQGKQSAADVLKPLAAKINPLLKGRYPAQEF